MTLVFLGATPPGDVDAVWERRLRRRVGMRGADAHSAGREGGARAQAAPVRARSAGRGAARGCAARGGGAGARPHRGAPVLAPRDARACAARRAAARPLAVSGDDAARRVLPGRADPVPLAAEPAGRALHPARVPGPRARDPRADTPAQPGRRPTGRITLRPWTEADVPAVTRRLRGPRDAALDGDPGHYEEEYARKYLEGREESRRLGQTLEMAIADARDARACSARSGSWRSTPCNRRGEVGYWVAPARRGAAAWPPPRCGCCPRRRSSSSDLIRLDLIAAVGNVASQRVAEKAGFTREGVMRSYLANKQGGRDDAVMFGRVRPDGARGECGMRPPGRRRARSAAGLRWGRTWLVRSSHPWPSRSSLSPVHPPAGAAAVRDRLLTATAVPRTCFDGLLSGGGRRGAAPLQRTLGRPDHREARRWAAKRLGSRALPRARRPAARRLQRLRIGRAGPGPGGRRRRGDDPGVPAARPGRLGAAVDRPARAAARTGRRAGPARGGARGRPRRPREPRGHRARRDPRRDRARRDRLREGGGLLGGRAPPSRGRRLPAQGGGGGPGRVRSRGAARRGPCRPVGAARRPQRTDQLPPDGRLPGRPQAAGRGRTRDWCEA